MGRHEGYHVFSPAFHTCVDLELSGISHQDILGICTLETPVFNNRNHLLVIVLLKFKVGEMIVFSAFGVSFKVDHFWSFCNGGIYRSWMSRKK